MLNILKYIVIKIKSLKKVKSSIILIVNEYTDISKWKKIL